MTRNAITQRYLDEMNRQGVEATEILALVQSSLDLKATGYEGRCLTRPAFLSHSERIQLEADLRNFHAALAALADRLFGGDLGEFARAAGMANAQIVAVERGQAEPLTRLGRADHYHDGTGFKLFEYNMGSTVGTLDNALLNRAFLNHRAMAKFVDENHLAYVDTMVELVQTLLTECEIPPGKRPVVAAADWPASFPNLEPQLRNSARALAPLGIDAIPCHLGQLEVRRGGVWVDGRKVDVIYRIFMIEDVLDPQAPALIDPVLRAAERGDVKMFTPLHAELHGSKAALAMLSDEANRHLHSDAELESLDRILPWTRMVREGSVTVDGESVELHEYAIAERDELALKPTSLHGGRGVVLGWRTTADEWRERVRGAMNGPYVLQRRIRAVPESFPATDGLQPWLLHWGIFTAINGYGGAVVRGSSDLAGGIVSITAGATASCCFHEEQHATTRS